MKYIIEIEKSNLNEETKKNFIKEFLKNIILLKGQKNGSGEMAEIRN